MFRKFTSYIEEYKLFQPGNSILLAVSGGLDSMVMTELFRQSRSSIGIAHCNFRLRGDESNKDEEFVCKMAEKFNIPFFIKRFSTNSYAKERKISVQMAARELRYDWFEEIQATNGFDYIATAHHRDDQIETLFINLLRGTGIAGLHGIPAKQGHLIRPLLFASKEEIEKYARTKQLSFREDSSNSSLKYTRNKIRHQLIPLLKSIQSDFTGNISTTINRIRDTESILRPYIEETSKKLIRKKQDHWVIKIADLTEFQPLQAWLCELLLPFGFNETTIHDLISHLHGASGKSFYSPEYRIIKDRDSLILTHRPKTVQSEDQKEYMIKAGETDCYLPIRLQLQLVTRTPDYQISSSCNQATLAVNKLTFPLTIRKWKSGDFFHPYGMNKRKKLSDFFIDEKISIPEKENTWLLCSGSRIVWIIGRRIDHRFRVTTQTKDLLIIDFLPE